MFASMWIGVIVSSFIFLIFRTLEGAEMAVLTFDDPQRAQVLPQDLPEQKAS